MKRKVIKVRPDNYFEEMIPEKRVKITLQEDVNITWVTDREMLEDSLFEELFSSPEFIEHIRDIDSLYQKDPTQFISLSKLYRETKKLKRDV